MATTDNNERSPPEPGGVLDESPTDPSRVRRLRAGRSADGPLVMNGVPLIGQILDNRYKVVELIARGGMGRVYRAEQAPLGRTVALKVLDVSGDPDTQEEFRGRFMREAAACARLSHPNTIRIFDYGTTWDDVLYIAMEYIDGRTLHKVIHEDAPMAPQRIVHMARQICHSLREAHGLGLIHRDLKPSNILMMRLDETEHVKVLDFGLVKEIQGDSKITRIDALVGSPSYMSPEQIRGGAIDQRSDIYSLGVVLYACLTGRTPFSGSTSINVLMAHLHNPPPPLGEMRPGVPVPPMLAWTVMTCLEKAAADRFASVDEILRALRLCDEEIRGIPVLTPHFSRGRVVLAEDPTPSVTSPRDLLIEPLDGPRGAGKEPTDSLILDVKRTRNIPIVAAMLVLGAGGLTLATLLLAGWLKPADPGLPEDPPVVVAPPPVEPAVVDGGQVDGGPVDPAPIPAPVARPVVSRPRPPAPPVVEPPVRIEPTIIVITAPVPAPAPPLQPPVAPPPVEPPRIRHTDIRDPWAR